ncbi:MAG: hypothetical protein AB7P23_05690 [Amphiplicatus sp.]
MTVYHLKLWSKGDLSRVYVNAEDGSSLGYFEERVRMAARGQTSSYDRHRLAKGDMEVEIGRDYACTLPADAAAKIYAAPEIAADIAASRNLDEWQKFHSLTRFARGRAAALIGNAAQKKAQRVREAFTVEL